MKTVAKPYIFVLLLTVFLLLFIPSLLTSDETGDLIEQYRKDLDSPYVPVRLNAVKELSKILDRRCADPLIYALNDESQFVRKEACTGLGKLKHPRAVEPLGLLLLKEEKTIVRKECAWALGNMGFVDAIPYLEKQLEKEESLMVKVEIEKALELLRN
ncbi:MAG: HEAT repeat domain-containing protein [Spirochaetota bacterium]